MEEEDLLNQPQVLNDTSSQRPTLYELFIRQSRKLGYAATKAYSSTTQLLKKDITLFNPLPQAGLSAKDANEELNKIIAHSKEILAKADAVLLPNNLFPDSVVVDRTKVTVTKRTFFWVSEVISVQIEDILNVSNTVGPIFGSLTISSRVMNSTDHYEINYFWRKDAIHLKHVIQGYMIAKHNEIDTSSLSKEQLIRKAEELGHNP